MPTVATQTQSQGSQGSTATTSTATTSTATTSPIGTATNYEPAEPRCVTHPDCPLRSDAHEEGDDLSSCAEIPDDPSHLPSRDKQSMYSEERDAWPGMPDERRAHTLIRVRRRAEANEERLARQKEREQACGAYVDALIAVGRLRGEERETARIRLDEARTTWHALRRKRR